MRLSCTVIVLILMTVDSLALAEPNEQLPVTVSVKSVGSAVKEPTGASAPAAMRAQEPPPATLPGERLPQYQSGFKKSEYLSQFNDGNIDFVLASKSLIDPIGRVLHVRLSVRIDGKPFTSMRQQIAQTLVESPAEEQDASNEVPESDSGNAAATEDPNETTDEKTLAGEDVDGENVAEDDEPTPEGSDSSQSRTPAYQLTTDPVEVARRYAQATGDPMSDEEAKWLLTHWTDGPSLLLLQPYFQSFRAAQRPAFRVLDRDRDGVVSKAELDAASTSIQQCDTDRDEIVDVLEIAQVAKALPRATSDSVGDVPLLLLVSDLETSVEEDPQLFALLGLLDRDQNRRVDASEIELLRRASPDVVLAVEFNTKTPGQSTLVLVSLSDRVALPVKSASDGIDIAVGPVTINFAAVQGSASRQVSLGAVTDGYPVLPMLDPNDDGRLTLRERRELSDRLRVLDRDGDGSLTELETTSPIRVCIGLGPTVHRELASVRAVPSGDQAEPVIGPDWFVRMDRNTDNDLSRAEFPGTDEQFAAMDADDDKLVSASEAIQFDKQFNSTEEN